MIRSDDDENDVSTDEVDNATVLVHALPVHNASVTTLTNNSQPMVLTTHDDMYEGFVEALLVNSTTYCTTTT